MSALRKYTKQREKAARIALVVVLHIGAAMALFGCAKPYRQVQIPEKPIEVALLEGRFNVPMGICTYPVLLPDPPVASRARIGSRHSRSRRKAVDAFVGPPPPVMCQAQRIAVPEDRDPPIILI